VLVLATDQAVTRKRDELFRFAKYLDCMLCLATIGALVLFGIVLTTA